MATTTEPVSTTATSEKEAQLLKWLQERTFIFWYRTRFRPTSNNVLAKDLTTAREKAETYCERFGLRFISIHPFFLDLDKKPEKPPEET